MQFRLGCGLFSEPRVLVQDRIKPSDGPCQMYRWALSISSSGQGWTGVPKAARENVRNGPKFAKTIYLSIDNRPIKLRFGTALVLRMSSGVNLGEVVDPGKKSIFPSKVSKISIFSGPLTQKFRLFQARIGNLQLLLGKLFYFSTKVTTFEHTSCR